VNYMRYKNLYDNKATSQSEYDRALLSYTTSKNDYLARKSNYGKVKNQLYIDMKNAESQYKVNAKDEDNYQLRSFINGMVYEVYKQRGETVRPNDPVALVGDMKELYMKLKVDELDINKVKVGQNVLIKVDVYKDKVFKAHITKIYPKLTKEDQTFRVDAVFDGATPEAYYGLSVEANIIISQKEKALTIPKTSLIGSDSVMVQTDKGFEKIKIQTGAEDLEYVEVVSGLNANAVIVKK